MKLAIIMTDGFEETEAIGTIDVIRRGIEILADSSYIDIVSLNNKKNVIGSHKISIEADKNFTDLKPSDYDGIIFPGGPGHKDYFTNPELDKVTLSFYESKKLIAAICAAPQYLGYLKILNGKEYTSYPTCDQYLDIKNKKETQCVITDNIITATSISSSIDFGLSICSKFLNKEQYNKLEKSLVRGKN